MASSPLGSTPPRVIRFGYQLPAGSSRDPVELAQTAEAIGFDVVVCGDHVGPGTSPMLTLAAIAAATERVRIGTLVLNATVRHPLHVAWEATTLDHLSQGRFELGLGAGHTPQEYRALGFDLAPARARKSVLMESVGLIRQLLEGRQVTHVGAHYRLDNAEVTPSFQPRLPVLVGGNGAWLLGQAGAVADIVGLQGLGRTLDDGHRHEVKWSAEHLDRQVAQVRAGAGERFAAVELNALVQLVRITDNANAVYRSLGRDIPGVNPRDLVESPYTLIGTTDEIIDKIYRCAHRWGITYFTVRELEPFAPILAAFAT